MVLAKKVSRCTIDPEMDQASCLSPKVRKSVVCPPVVIVLYQCELSRKTVAVVLVHEGHLLFFTEKRCDCPHGSFAWVLRPVFGRDRCILNGEVAASGGLCRHLQFVCGVFTRK